MVFVRAEKHKTWFARHCPTFTRAINNTLDAIQIRSLARRLNSDDPQTRGFAAWKLKCAAEGGKDISFVLRGLDPKKIIDTLRDPQQQEQSNFSAMLFLAIKHGSTDTSHMLDIAESTIACNGMQHSISLHVVRIIGSARREKQRAMEMLIGLLADAHASNHVRVCVMENMLDLTKRGADPSNSFGMLIGLLPDKDDYWPRHMKDLAALGAAIMAILKEAGIRGFDITSAMPVLFKKILTFNRDAWDIVRSFAENGGENARSAITVEIHAVLQSHWFMGQAEANSINYENLITYFAGVMAVMQMTEKGLKHAAASGI